MKIGVSVLRPGESIGVIDYGKIVGIPMNTITGKMVIDPKELEEFHIEFNKLKVEALARLKGEGFV